MTIQLKGGYEANDARLGRVPEWDPRNEDYPVRELLADRPREPRRKTWRLDGRVYQGNFPRCVGYAWTHDHMAAPRRRKGDDALAIRWYDTAQRNDEWAGENYAGSSTLGGAKAGVHFGFFTEYRWCLTLADVIDTVAWLGPVVTGTWWYRSMFAPAADGRVTISGTRDGGHEWVLIGVNPHRDEFEAQNTWQGWGVKRSRFRITFADYERLLNEDGDACYPVR